LSGEPLNSIASVYCSFEQIPSGLTVAKRSSVEINGILIWGKIFLTISPKVDSFLVFNCSFPQRTTALNKSISAIQRFEFWQILIRVSSSKSKNSFASTISKACFSKYWIHLSTNSVASYSNSFFFCFH